jgi:propionyl-CoA synthetase
MTESDAEGAWARLGAEPGLCLTCRHAKLNQTRRGTAYLRCGRSAWDERLVRYPRLPVLDCIGFETRQTGHAAGTTDRSAENLRPEPWVAAGDPCRARTRVIAGGNPGSAGIDCSAA